MADYHDLVQALTWLLVNKLQAKSEYTRGLLGDGAGKVQVPGRPDYTYVRPDRFSTRVYEVFNKMVSGPDGLPVVLGELPWQPGLTQVLSVDWDTYLGVGWGDLTPGLPRHGQTHQWRDGAPGYDAFHVYRRQMGELRTYPIGSGSASVYVSPYDFTHFETVRAWSGLPGLDLSGAVPSATGTARFVLTYWDPCSGTSGFLGVVTGTIGVDAGPEILNRPAAPAGTIPSAYVRLAGGQGSVTEFDIWDARPLWAPSLKFATGSCGIWAGMIPIGDPGSNFTGTTVEAALEELADGGGGAPSGPAGGDLTGSYPNPTVDGLLTRPLGLEPTPSLGDVLTWTGSAWRPATPTSVAPTGPAGGDLTGTYPDPTVDGLLGRPLGLNPVDEYYMLMYTGSAWQPTPGPFKLVAPDGAPDPALYSDNSGNIIGAQWIAGDASGFVVENRASGTVSAGAIGYISEDGYFVQTATAYNNVVWAVVLNGGGHQQDIHVARRGRVTVTLNGNCSAGDYLYTSTTAGQAQPQSYVRPEVFAVALTANGDGAGGTCEALLLCNRVSKPLLTSNDIIYIDAASDSDWQTTQNGAVAGAVVTYNVPLTYGSEDAIVPQSSSELGKLVLHNTTQGEEAYIESVDTGANTITVTAAADISGWANNDVLKVRSQTNTTSFGGGTVYFFDIEVTSSDIPELTTALDALWVLRDSGAAGQYFWWHPYEADDAPKRYVITNQVTSIGFQTTIPMYLINRRFCLAWNASGASTARNQFRVRQATVAAP